LTRSSARQSRFRRYRWVAGAVCVGTATATVVACGHGSTSQAAKQVQKPAAVASSSTPVVSSAPVEKLADATPVVQTQPAQQRYIVASGDTLWSISARSYGAGDAFTRIVQANPTITDPNQIFVGESLIIPDASVPAPAPAADLKPVTTAMQVPAKAPAPAPVVHKTVALAAAPVVVSGGGAGGVWACIRQHESGGNYATNTGNGYYGAYQFSLSTWRAMGGSGLPSNAPPAVQDAMAQKLQAQSGFGQWPVTSRMCGVR
jgi:LysM repeat protein